MHDVISQGASLYVPATHPDIVKIACGDKLSNVRSIIFCTEDSVSDHDVPMALRSLAHALQAFCHVEARYRFIRVRSPNVLEMVLQMPGIKNIDGFVLPKISHNNFDDYMEKLTSKEHVIMPTLETREAFSEFDMNRLLALFDRPGVRERIYCLRIGGNDLLSLLGMRRPRGRTIYQTPIGPIISKLVTTFKPHGFNLSAPVFEYLDDSQTLDREVEEDLDHGLVGKSAIHPSQVQQIEKHYLVNVEDLEAARQILSEGSAAVFRFQDSMCEPSTHRNWAINVLELARHHGHRTKLSSVA